tara:strand:- start:527 stop:1201 length:675 start_codon:yes stop_codon:yes gene_type:complete
MASLGGLDVAFGAQMQIVRTNVLIVETDGTTTQTQANNVLSCARNRYVSHMKPDYIAFVASGALTEGYATELTDQVESNVLKDITKVPLAGSQRDSTASNNRGMSIEAILNVGIVQINADDTATADDLFLETAGSTSGEDVGSTEFTYSEQMQSALMKDAFDDQAEPTTMNLTAVLTDSAILGGSAQATADFASISETSSLADLNDAIAGAGGVISVLALGKIF